MANSDLLRAVLTDREIRLEPLNETHFSALRDVCAQDQAIWEIYPESMVGEHFDTTIAGRFSSEWVSFAVLKDDVVVGITGYRLASDANRTVEIGGTYIAPSVRGTDLNRRNKTLLIDHAFACGFQRIEFRADERNTRSQAAIMKLGAQREGMLRHDRITWTGHVRNTCIFGLLREEWNR